MSKKLLLFDAYALIYRAYFAFINRPMKNSKGLNTSAIFGFTKTMLDAIKRIDPTHIAVAFDLSGPTFRTEIYSDYKANRQETPEDIRSAVPVIKELLDAMNIKVIQLQGFEADDVIGSAAKQAEKQGFEVFMMTPDKDYGQLLSPNIKIVKPGKAGNDMEFVTEGDFCKGYEIESSEQFIDILALWGDAVDNIKGVNKVGEKTAAKLVSTYGNIENILKNTEKLTPALKENLDSAHELLKLNRVLVKIRTDLDLNIDIDALHRKEPNLKEFRTLLEELEFRSLLKEFSAEKEPESKKEKAIQGSLFDTLPVQPEKTEEKYLTIKDIEYTYITADTEAKRSALIKELSDLDEFAFDTETTGLDIINAELVGMSFSSSLRKAWYVPVPADKVQAKALVSEFKSLLENPAISKVGQNIKFDLQVMRNYDINLQGKLLDTMLAHYLLEPDQRHNLNILSEQLLGYKPIEIEELIGKKGANQINMRYVPIEKVTVYAAEDADLALQLKRVLFKKLQSEELISVYETIEAPLITVLAEMERTGVCIDTKALADYAKILNQDLIKLDEEIKIIAGLPNLNISSPRQLGEVLFERLKISSDIKLTKTKQYSTSEEELLKYRDKHPIIDKILEFRSLKKLLSTYIEALPMLINPKTGKIHTSFNQAVASTGRLSSNNPNLQNIPIRDEKGREIRKAFIPSSENHLILSADYSQIELRLMAHMSQDKLLIDAFQNGEDIHAATASKIFKIPLSEVTKEQRSKAKTANFGMIYGISAFGLSQRLSISRTEAKELIDGYFNTYGGVKEYMDKCIADARKTGWVVTLLGRKRYLPDINSHNGTVRGLAERNAINAPIQGSAADIIKLAMIKIHGEISKRNLQSRMIIQVHDELVLDVVKSELEEIKELVKKSMEEAVSLSVPIEVDMGVGFNWLEAH